jgi:hypothetical protein
MIWGPESEIRAMAVPPVDLTLTLKREYAMAIATGEKSWEARHLTGKGKLFHLKAGDRVSFTGTRQKGFQQPWQKSGNLSQ